MYVAQFIYFQIDLLIHSSDPLMFYFSHNYFILSCIYLNVIYSFSHILTNVHKPPPTKEALVVSWWKRVSKHHHLGINNDLLTLPRWGRDLMPSSTPVQSQGEFSAVAIQLHLVPVSVIKAMEGQRDVEVTIAKVVENSQQALNNLRCIVGLNLLEIQTFKQRKHENMKIIFAEPLRLSIKHLQLESFALKQSYYFLIILSLSKTAKGGDTYTTLTDHGSCHIAPCWWAKTDLEHNNIIRSRPDPVARKRQQRLGYGRTVKSN